MPRQTGGTSTAVGNDWDVQNRDPGLDWWDSWDEIPIGQDPVAPQQQRPGAGGLPISTPTAPPPATPTATIPGAAGSMFSAKDASGYAAIINAIVGAYGALKPNKFHQAPDPMNDALRARLYGFIDDSPSRNVFGQALIDYINQGKGQNMPMAPSKYGYDPYPNGTPKYDLSGLIPMIQGTMGKPQGSIAGGGGSDAPEPDMRGQKQLSAPAPAAQLSQQDAMAFKAFVGQYGQQAGEAVAVMIEQNPGMDVHAAMQRVMQTQGQVA